MEGASYSNVQVKGPSGGGLLDSLCMIQLNHTSAPVLYCARTGTSAGLPSLL